MRLDPPSPLGKGGLDNKGGLERREICIDRGNYNSTLSPPYLWRSLPEGRRGFRGIESN